VVALAISISVAGAVSAQMPSAGRAAPREEVSSVRITPESARLTNYLRDLAGPPAILGIVGGGLLQHLRQRDGTDDLGERIASRAAQQAVQVSVRHGLAAVMHRDGNSHYQACECHGLAPRVGHALLETFTDRRSDGSRALAVPRIAGAYAGGFARLAWEHDRSPGSVAANATVSLGMTALFNVARELTGLGR